ncbi:MAG: ubiquitin carboxyl-terminal hydrolase family protein, partial [Bacteroidota bacterium]
DKANDEEVKTLSDLDAKLLKLNDAKGKEDWSEVADLEQRVTARHEDKNILGRAYDNLAGGLSWLSGKVTNLALQSTVAGYLKRRFGLNILHLNLTAMPGTYGSINVNELTIGPSKMTIKGNNISVKSAKILGLHLYLGTKGALSLASDLAKGRFKSLTEFAGEVELQSLQISDLEIELNKTEKEKTEKKGKITLDVMAKDAKLIAGDNLFKSIYDYLSSKLSSKFYKTNPKEALQAIIDNARGALNVKSLHVVIKKESWIQTEDGPRIVAGEVTAHDVLAAATIGQDGVRKARASIGGVELGKSGTLREDGMISVDQASINGIGASFYDGKVRAGIQGVQAGGLQVEKPDGTKAKVAKLSLGKTELQGRQIKGGIHAMVDTGEIGVKGITAQKGNDLAAKVDSVSVSPIKADAVVPMTEGTDKKPTPDIGSISSIVQLPKVGVQGIHVQKGDDQVKIKDIAAKGIHARSADGYARAGLHGLEASGIEVAHADGNKLKSVDERQNIMATVGQVNFVGASMDNDYKGHRTVGTGGLGIHAVKVDADLMDSTYVDSKNPSKGKKKEEQKLSVSMDKAGVRPISMDVEKAERGQPTIGDVHVGGVFVDNLEVMNRVLGTAMVELHQLDINVNKAGNGKGVADVTISSALAESIKKMPGFVGALLSSNTTLSFDVNKGNIDLGSLNIKNERKEHSKSKFKLDKTIIHFAANKILNMRVTTTKPHKFGFNEKVAPRLRVDYLVGHQTLELGALGISEKQNEESPAFIPKQDKSGGEGGMVHLGNLIRHAIQSKTDEAIKASETPASKKSESSSNDTDTSKGISILTDSVKDLPQTETLRQKIAKAASILQEFTNSGIQVNQVIVAAILEKEGIAPEVDKSAEEKKKKEQGDAYVAPQDTRPSHKIVTGNIQSIGVGATAVTVDLKSLVKAGKEKQSQKKGDKPFADLLGQAQQQVVHPVMPDVQYDTGQIQHVANSCYLASLIHVFASHADLYNLFNRHQHVVALENDPAQNLQLRQGSQAIGLALQMNSGIHAIIQRLRDPNQIIGQHDIGQVMTFLGLVGNILEEQDEQLSKKAKKVELPPLLSTVKQKAKELTKKEEETSSKVEPKKVDTTGKAPSTYGVQQDASEVLAKLLQYLRPGHHVTIQQDSILGPDGHAFHGSTTHTTENTLQLPITGNIHTLEGALRKYSEQERVDYANGQVTKEIKFSRLPNVLTIVLKRFEFDDYGGRRKVHKEIEVPTEFTMPQQCLNGPLVGQQVRYKLLHFTKHDGHVGGGHYTSFAKNQHGEWYKHNDMGAPRRTTPGLMEFQNNLYTGYIYVFERV